MVQIASGLKLPKSDVIKKTTKPFILPKRIDRTTRRLRMTEHLRSFCASPHKYGAIKDKNKTFKDTNALYQCVLNIIKKEGLPLSAWFGIKSGQYVYIYRELTTAYEWATPDAIRTARKERNISSNNIIGARKDTKWQLDV